MLFQILPYGKNFSKNFLVICSLYFPSLRHFYDFCRFLQCSKRSYRSESPLLKFVSSKSVHSEIYYRNEEVNCCN